MSVSAEARLGIQPRVKSLWSSHAGLYPQSTGGVSESLTGDTARLGGLLRDEGEGGLCECQGEGTGGVYMTLGWSVYDSGLEYI